MVYFLLRSPYPRGRMPIAVEQGTGNFREEKNLLALPGFETRGLVAIPTTPSRSTVLHRLTSFVIEMCHKSFHICRGTPYCMKHQFVWTDRKFVDMIKKIKTILIFNLLPSCMPHLALLTRYLSQFLELGCRNITKQKFSVFICLSAYKRMTVSERQKWNSTCAEFSIT